MLMLAWHGPMGGGHVSCIFGLFTYLSGPNSSDTCHYTDDTMWQRWCNPICLILKGLCNAQVEDIHIDWELGTCGRQLTPTSILLFHEHRGGTRKDSSSWSSDPRGKIWRHREIFRMATFETWWSTRQQWRQMRTWKSGPT